MPPRPFQQHRCAPLRKTPSPPLHLLRRLDPPVRRPATVKSLKFQSQAEGRSLGGARRCGVRAGEAASEGASACSCQRSSVHAALLRQFSYCTERVCSCARRRSSQRGSAAERVPVRSAIIMLTGRGGWGY